MASWKDTYTQNNFGTSHSCGGDLLYLKTRISPLPAFHCQKHNSAIPRIFSSFPNLKLRLLEEKWTLFMTMLSRRHKGCLFLQEASCFHIFLQLYMPLDMQYTINTTLDSRLPGVKTLAATAVSWLEGSTGTQGCQPQ